MRKIFILPIAVLLLSFIVLAQEIKVVPYVNDFAGILNQEQINSLNQLCDQIKTNTSVEIAIVTLNHSEDDPVLLAARIITENGVGNNDLNNGLLVLYLVDDKKGAISTGRGIESVITDAEASKIGRDNSAFFGEGKYYEGLTAIVQNLSSKLEPVKPSGQDSPSWMIWLVILIVVILFAFLALSPKSHGESSGAGVAGAVVGTVLGGRSSGGFGGGSSGGGGSRF